MLYRVRASWRGGEYPLVVANGKDLVCAAVSLFGVLTGGESEKYTVTVSISDTVTEIVLHLDQEK